MKYTGCLAIGIIVAGLTGCGKSSGSALPEPPCISTCEPGQPGGKLTLAIPGNPKTFNPLMAFDGASDAVVRLMFGSLVNRDFATHALTPGLAESWSVAEDQKTWTFKLRQGLRWSDGQPLTADDVVFTWNAVMYNPNYNRLTYDLFRIGGTNFAVSKVDELTVRVATPEVYAPFVDFFGSVAVLPRHLLEKPAQTGRFPTAYAVSTSPERMVGSGPFRLKAFEPGKSVRLERNPEFWIVDKQGRRLPYLDEVTLVVAADNPTAVSNLFLAGQCDVLEGIRQDPWEPLNRSRERGGFNVYNLGPGISRDFLLFNQNTNHDASGRNLVPPGKLKWFRDKTFRQAIACAINRERLVKETFAGRAQAITGLISSDNPQWNNPAIPQFGNDPEKARRLAASLGIQDRNQDGILEDAEGQPVGFTLLSNSENPSRAKVAALIQEDLQRAGFQVTVQLVDFETLLRKVERTFDYECVLMGFGGGGNEPASQINLLKSSETLHQWFPMQPAPSTAWEARIDWLMDAQMRTLDTAARKKLFDEVQAIWAEELPMISLVAPFSCAAARSNLANFRPASASSYPLTWNIEELFLQPALAR